MKEFITSDSQDPQIMGRKRRENPLHHHTVSILTNTIDIFGSENKEQQIE